MARPEIVSDPRPPGSLRIDGTLPPRPRVALLRTKYKVGLALGSVAFVAAAALVVVLAWHEGERLTRLRDHGVVTDAIVERKWTSGGKSKTKYASYSYVCDGQSYTDEASVSSRRWDAIVPGKTIRITYDPADPSDTEVGAVTQATLDGHWLAVTVTGSVVGATLLAFLIHLLFHHHRRKSLLMDGDLVSAKVESVGRASRKGRRCKVAFQVPVGEGTVESRRHSVPQKLIAGIEPGESVAYLVMRDFPKRGAPLGLCLQSCRLE